MTASSTVLHDTHVGTHQRATQRPSTRVHRLVMAVGVAAVLAGCAGSVDIQNRHAAQEMAQRAAPQGSVYTGWRVFQDKCAACHGPAALGTGTAPNLLPRVRDVGPRQFVDLVLKRYDWQLPATQPGAASGEREALIEQILQRRAGEIAMPAWEGEPRVSAHIADLYAYLAARADGRQGPERPAP